MLHGVAYFGCARCSARSFWSNGSSVGNMERHSRVARERPVWPPCLSPTTVRATLGRVPSSPAVRPKLYGFLVAPNNGLKVLHPVVNSGMFVFPMVIAPALRILATVNGGTAFRETEACHRLHGSPHQFGSNRALREAPTQTSPELVAETHADHTGASAKFGPGRRPTNPECNPRDSNWTIPAS